MGFFSTTTEFSMTTTTTSPDPTFTISSTVIITRHINTYTSIIITITYPITLRSHYHHHHDLHSNITSVIIVTTTKRDDGENTLSQYTEDPTNLLNLIDFVTFLIFTRYGFTRVLFTTGWYDKTEVLLVEFNEQGGNLRYLIRVSMVRFKKRYHCYLVRGRQLILNKKRLVVWNLLIKWNDSVISRSKSW